MDADIRRAALAVLAATAASLGLHAPNLQAQPTLPTSAPPSVRATAPSSTSYDAALKDYLLLLGQIAPAAQLGAQDYLQAYAQRCGRLLDVMELRKAFSSGDGDPVLMAMISARHQSAHQLDPTGTGAANPPQAKLPQIVCAPRGLP